jgi:phage FluMu protein Com
MSKVETVCPHCKKANTVEKASFGVSAYAHPLQDIQCSHCSKSWKEDLGATGSELAKSVQPTSLAELRVQVRAQFDELLKQINALQERRAAASRPAKFQPGGVEKSDTASQELEKALSNGKPVAFQTSERSSPRFQTVESVGSGQRTRSGRPFDANGAEKSETADAELHKALANGEPVGLTRRGN